MRSSARFQQLTHGSRSAIQMGFADRLKKLDKSIKKKKRKKKEEEKKLAQAQKKYDEMVAAMTPAERKAHEIAEKERRFCHGTKQCLKLLITEGVCKRYESMPRCQGNFDVEGDGSTVRCVQKQPGQRNGCVEGQMKSSRKSYKKDCMQ